VQFCEHRNQIQLETKQKPTAAGWRENSHTKVKRAGWDAPKKNLKNFEIQAKTILYSTINGNLLYIPKWNFLDFSSKTTTFAIVFELHIWGPPFPQSVIHLRFVCSTFL